MPETRTDALAGIELAAAPLGAGAPVGSSTTHVQVLGPHSPNQVVFAYDTPPGNQPNTYGNTAFLWQTSGTAVPVGTTPIASARVAGNQPVGTNMLPALLLPEPYLLAYATGPRVENVCSVAYIPVSGPGTGQAPSVSTVAVGSTWLAYAYDLPAGLRPASSGHWVGLWQGRAQGLHSVRPLAFAAVTQDTSSGEAALNGLILLRGADYTLGYFAGGYAPGGPSQTTLACSYTFST